MISPVQKRGKGPAWWLRKKVPLALRKVVGRAEVWRSLETTERREANTRCAVMSANLEIEWARLATKAAGSNPYPGLELPHSAPSHRDLLGMARKGRPPGLRKASEGKLEHCDSARCEQLGGFHREEEFRETIGRRCGCLLSK